MSLIPTPWQTVGPYLHIGLTDTRSVGQMAAAEAAGERVALLCRVFDGDGIALPDAMIELWQADAEGRYHHPQDAPERVTDPSFRGHGRLPTNAEGSCWFHTIKPGSVAGPDGTQQAPHINVSVLGRGLLKRLATRIYFAGEAANATDPVLALVPDDRRATLMAQRDPSSEAGWNFDIYLCGPSETVFFDV